MVTFNNWPICDDGIIPKKYVRTTYDKTSSPQENRINFQFDDDSDFTTLQRLCDTVNRVPCAVTPILNIPYFPYSYGEITPKFMHYVNMINGLNLKFVRVVEASSNFDAVPLLDLRNLEISAKRAIMQMKAEILGPKLKDYERSGSIYLDSIKNLFEEAKKAGIYLLFASNFDTYKTQMLYDNILCDAEDCSDDCRRVIIVDSLLSDLAKYEVLTEELRANNPALEHITVCTAHCTNDMYGSDLIKNGNIDTLITTNSLMKVRFDVGLSVEELHAIRILDAFNQCESFKPSAAMSTLITD